jgi:electron transfer flavoprotein alpha subunit
MGNGVEGLAETLIRYGADRVVVVEDSSLEQYRAVPYATAFEQLIGRHKPNILLMGATHMGRDLAPRVSRRVAVGLTADCTELTIDPDEKILLQTRPAFGGNVMATIANRYSRPQMATVRPGVMEQKEQPGKKGDVIRESVSIEGQDLKTKVLEVVREAKKGGDLSKAKIIVAGGRGVGDGDGFKVLENLADVLGGQVAGTRVAVEEGWIPADRQVGRPGSRCGPNFTLPAAYPEPFSIGREL